MIAVYKKFLMMVGVSIIFFHSLFVMIVLINKNQNLIILMDMLM